MIIGFMFLFVLTFVEIYCTKKSVSQTNHKNIITSLLITSSILTSIILYLINGVDTNDFILFEDWKLYFCLIINATSFYVIRKNFEINKENITAVNFGMFASLLLLIPISYFLSEPLGFSGALNLKYNSIYEMLLYFGVYSLIIFIYFANSFKNTKIKSFKLLLIMIVFAAFSSFINVKMMQIYNGYLTYACMSIGSLFLFVLLIMKNKEFKNIATLNKKEAFKVSFAWASLSPIYVFVNTVLPVEFLSVFKRTFSIINGALIDKLNNINKKTFQKREIVLVISMLLVTVIYYLKTG